MSFPRYPKYKPSGVEALGDVPVNWELCRLGDQSWVRARLGWKGLKAEEYVDDGFALLSTPNIKGRAIDFDGVNYITRERYEESPEIMLRIGDVLLAKDGSTLGTVNVVRELPRAATVNGSIAVLTPTPKLNSGFLHYFLSSAFIDQTIQQMKGGMGVPHLFQADLRKFSLLLPSIPEQKQIAAFLDIETAKIDALVAEQARLIELLKEKRQAVICHAVTKGLNPNAPMKESGIEWIGQVPAHWEILRLGMLGTFKGGAGFPDEHQGRLDLDLPFFKVGDISKAEPDGGLQHPVHTISHSTAATLRASVFPTGSIVFAKVGAALLLQRYRWLAQPSCIDNNMMGMTLNVRCDRRHLLYLLPLLDLELIVNPGAVPSINEGQISGQRVPCPPNKDEAAAIAKHLDTATTSLDALMAEAQRAIDLLHERRAALISAAVAGQIDVRPDSMRTAA